MKWWIIFLIATVVINIILMIIGVKNAPEIDEKDE